MNNYIINYIDLTVDSLITVDTIKKDTTNTINLNPLLKYAIKEYKEFFIKHIVFNNNSVILNINNKRYQCNDCKSTFTE